MEIKSEPEQKTYEVTDLDFMMVGHVPYSITFPTAEDRFTQTADEFTLTLKGEVVHILKHQVLWWSERKRMFTEPVKAHGV